MSVICDVLVYTTHNDAQAADAVRFDPDRRDQRLGRVDTGEAGGSKAFCGYVFAAGLNHVPPVDAEHAIAAVGWRDPEHTIVVLDAYDYDIPPYATTVAAIRNGTSSLHRAYPEHGEAGDDDGPRCEHGTFVGGMEMCRQCLDEGRDPSIPPTHQQHSGKPSAS